MTANDVDYDKIFAALGRSKFRSRFRLKGKVLTYALEKGVETLRLHAVDFISSRIAPMEPLNDGRQTPMGNHPVFVAQHATATCCRGCIEKWHDIPKGRELSDNEREFIVELIMMWLKKQLKENVDI
jgi:predicted Fe-S protein YdhL (DUF1289 family)